MSDCFVFVFFSITTLFTHQMLVVLTDKLLKTQIVDPSAVANWLFSADMAPDFTKWVLVQDCTIVCCFTLIHTCICDSINNFLIC